MNKIDKVCPKCGYDDVYMEFKKIGTKFYEKDKDCELLKEYLGERKDSTTHTYATAKIIKECVKVHCRTCQYAWVSDTSENLEPLETPEANETNEPENAFGMSKEDIEKLIEDFKHNPIIVMPPHIDPWIPFTHDKTGINPLEGIYPSTCNTTTEDGINTCSVFVDDLVTEWTYTGAKYHKTHG